MQSSRDLSDQTTTRAERGTVVAERESQTMRAMVQRLQVARDWAAETCPPPSSMTSDRSQRGDAFARYGVSERSTCSVRQARLASCRLNRVSGEARSWPEISRMRCRRYLSVLRCTDSAWAVAS